MNLVVIGQRGNGPAMRRTVTPYEFFWAWGRFAKWLLENAQDQTVEIDGCKVRVVAVP